MICSLNRLIRVKLPEKIVIVQDPKEVIEVASLRKEYCRQR